LKPVNVGVLGLGTVGGGTVNVLKRNAEEITRRAGRGIVVSHAAARDPDKQRICDTSGITLTNDPFEVVNDPDVQIIVELIGGDALALELVMKAVENGKHLHLKQPLRVVYLLLRRYVKVWLAIKSNGWPALLMEPVILFLPRCVITVAILVMC